MARHFGFAPAFRWPARLSPFALGLGYTITASVATALYYLGRIEGRSLVEFVGALGALTAISYVFTVVTWYRKDEVVQAAFLLGTTMPIGNAIGMNVGAIIAARDTGGSTLFVVGSFFGIPIGVLVWTIVFAILVSAGRRFHHLVGPDSTGDVSEGS